MACTAVFNLLQVISSIFTVSGISAAPFDVCGYLIQTGRTVKGTGRNFKPAHCFHRSPSFYYFGMPVVIWTLTF